MRQVVCFTATTVLATLTLFGQTSPPAPGGVNQPSAPEQKKSQGKRKPRKPGPASPNPDGTVRPPDPNDHMPKVPPKDNDPMPRVPPQQQRPAVPSPNGEPRPHPPQNPVPGHSPVKPPDPTKPTNPSTCTAERVRSRPLAQRSARTRLIRIAFGGRMSPPNAAL
jgi:hypothetical protein